MEDAIAKPARDTSMETLHAMFGQLMASVTGSFGDREAAALKHRSDTAIDRICRRLCELEAHQLFAYCEGAPLPTYWAASHARRSPASAPRSPGATSPISTDTEGTCATRRVVDAGFRSAAE